MKLANFLSKVPPTRAWYLFWIVYCVLCCLFSLLDFIRTGDLFEVCFAIFFGFGLWVWWKAYRLKYPSQGKIK